MADVDKYHRNGPKEDDQQEIIIRFKTHSAKEDFYEKRKTIPASARLKVQPSLSPGTKKLLGTASDFVNGLKAHDEVDEEGERKIPNCPDFVFADVHGNLLLKFCKREKDGMFFRFNSMEQLAMIVQKYNAVKETDEEYEKLMVVSNIIH